MAANIPALLDKAQLIHKLPSDYKLALVMGISASSLTSYRHGKTLPDARVIKKICDLTGDDPDVLAAEIEAQRAQTDEARALWLRVSQRLQGVVHSAVLAVGVVIALTLAVPMDASAQTATSALSQKYTSWNLRARRWVARHTARLRHFAHNPRLFTWGNHVPRAASTATA